MRALIVTALTVLAASASAQVPTYYATTLDADKARPSAHATAPALARVQVGITRAWPTSPDAYDDYAAYEIEAGTRDGDLFVRWTPFFPDADAFRVVVLRDGQPYESIEGLEASPEHREQGVRLNALPGGMYTVELREVSLSGVEIVSAPVRVRVR